MSAPTPSTVSVLIDIKQVREMLNCSTRHVQRLADRHAMPRPVRLGNLVRWRRDEIENWVSQGCPKLGKAVKP